MAVLVTGLCSMLVLVYFDEKVKNITRLVLFMLPLRSCSLVSILYAADGLIFQTELSQF